MGKSRILVVLGNEHWNNQAMHLACAMARNEYLPVTLVHPVPVANPGQLGNIDIHPEHTPKSQRAIHELTAIAEEYQVSYENIQLHYTSYINGISSAVEELHALAIFAPLPKHKLKVIDHIQSWRIHHALKCPLFTLDPEERSGRDEKTRKINQVMTVSEAHIAPKN